jgi:hypothetical protein
MTTVDWIEKQGPLTVTVHSFRMGDVEDPDLYAAEPLWQWQNTDMGEWVMTNAVQTPSWHRHTDPSSFGWTYTIRAELAPKDYTFWWFKWGHALTK